MLAPQRSKGEVLCYCSVLCAGDDDKGAITMDCSTAAVTLAMSRSNHHGARNKESSGVRLVLQIYALKTPASTARAHHNSRAADVAAADDGPQSQLVATPNLTHVAY